MFNLVYTSNMASVKLWQKLGFTHTGTCGKRESGLGVG